jgi:hypothetical protein
MPRDLLLTRGYGCLVQDGHVEELSSLKTTGMTVERLLRLIWVQTARFTMGFVACQTDKKSNHYHSRVQNFKLGEILRCAA